MIARALLVAFSASLLIASHGFADELRIPIGGDVRIDVQIVSLHQEIALKLIPQLRTKDTASEAYSRVQALLENGEAQLLGWPVVWQSTDGPNTESEAIYEYRYSTKFLPPGPPNPGSVVHPAFPERLVQFAPTSFETRNLGATLAVQAVFVHRSGSITVELVPTFSRLLGVDRHLSASSLPGVRHVIEQPSIQSLRCFSAISVHDGEPTLLTFMSLTKPEPQIVLFLFRAKAMPRPK